jgi:AcrR family transcriptional regulator
MPPPAHHGNATPRTGRGHYDRNASASERAQRHREALLEAALELGSNRDSIVTVDGIVAACRSGRNTFYSHFEGVAELLEATSRKAAARFQAALPLRAFTISPPIEAISSGAAAWFEAVEAQPREARFLLFRDAGALRRCLREHFAPCIAVGIKAGMWTHANDDLRLACLYAAASELTEAALGGKAAERCSEVLAGTAAAILR